MRGLKASGYRQIPSPRSSPSRGEDEIDATSKYFNPIYLRNLRMNARAEVRGYRHIPSPQSSPSRGEDDDNGYFSWIEP